MSQANPKKSRPTGQLAGHRARLRQEAEERQAVSAARSIEERLALLDSRPGNSERERARLRQALAARKAGGEKKQSKYARKRAARTGKDFIPRGRGH